MITALISQKGGVGKTTSAVNLAAALAAKGRRVLLIDLDPQASTSLSLGVPRSRLAPSVADVLLRNMPAREAVRETRLSQLDLLTASADLSGAEEELAPLPRKETRLAASLEAVADLYDHLVLDCAAALSLLPRCALVAADNFVVPVVPHYLALEGVRNMLAFAGRLVFRYGARPELAGLLLTMVDYRTRVSRDNVEAVRREYGERVFAIEIRTNIRLAEAPELGLTIFEHDSSSTGAHSYRLLAEEFLLRTEGAHVTSDEPLASQVVLRTAPA